MTSGFDWTDAGSPLAVWTEKQSKLLRGWLGEAGFPVLVRHAMRYGQPSIASQLDALKAEGATRILILPLYPQYSDSATGSVLDLVPEGMRYVRDFHAHPAYIEALAAQVRRHRRNDRLVMSFHGLPKRGAGEYPAQCQETARLLAEKLGLRRDEWKATFQSRFGFAEWLQPYTEPTLIELAKAGGTAVDVFCPGFVSDCLETLEEIGITARARFMEAGGRDFNLIPCLNETPEWIEALRQIAASA